MSSFCTIVFDQSAYVTTGNIKNRKINKTALWELKFDAGRFIEWIRKILI